MKTMALQEPCGEVSTLLESDEALLLTRAGRPAGILYPFGHPERLPLEVRRLLFGELSGRIGEQIDEQGLVEDDLMRDFDEHRQERRRRL